MRDPAAASGHDSGRHRDGHALGRAGRAARSPRRLPPPVGPGAGRRHRGQHEGQPDRRALRHQAVPEERSNPSAQDHLRTGRGDRTPLEDLDLRHDDLLFPANGCSGGGPISRENFRKRVWLPTLRRASLGVEVRFHDLRHTHASWLLAGGADLKVVMDRMGHAHLATTQRYLHTLPNADDRALDAFQRTRSS